MESCVYEGQVWHGRTTPPHKFRYSLFMICLDLDQLQELFRERWLWSVNRPNIAYFNRKYHLGEPHVPLSQSVRKLVSERLGAEPGGPIRMLTQMRYFGCNFNPVSFYYCFDSEGKKVEAIVVEIHNTPWGELFTYVLGEEMNEGTEMEKRFRLTKKFHISPFMDMNLSYQWEFSEPGESLSVHMTSYENEMKVFEAKLLMKRRDMTGLELSRMIVKYPFMNLKIISAIYWQAFRLRVKGATFYPHPLKRENPPGGSIR